jgi:hypothetical protein
MRTRLRTISFYQGTAAVLERAECLIGRDFGENLVVVPRAVRLFGLLDLEQEHAVHHTAVLAQHAVVGEGIPHRRFTHLGQHRLRASGACGLRGLEVVQRRAVGGRLIHGRHALHAIEETLVAAFQVLINCLEENDAVLPGQFPDALGIYMEMVKSRKGDVSDMTLAVLHDIRTATLD